MHINLAIIGSMSVGKTTLVNAIFGFQLSEMKMGKATTIPQIYEESNIEYFNSQDIYVSNNDLNSFFDKKITDINFHKIVYKTPSIDCLNGKFKARIYDIPGLNDVNSSPIYFEYLENHFNIFDIIVIVLDINHANIIQDNNYLFEFVSKQSPQQDIIIIVNKCDDLTEEHKAIVKKLGDYLIDKIKCVIIPMSAQLAYCYRVFKNNPAHDDIMHENIIGKREFGIQKWHSLKNKGNNIQKILSRNYDHRLEQTGFKKFIETLNCILSNKNESNLANGRLRYIISQRIAQKEKKFKPELLDYLDEAIKHLGDISKGLVSIGNLLDQYLEYITSCSFLIIEHVKDNLNDYVLLEKIAEFFDKAKILSSKKHSEYTELHYILMENIHFHDLINFDHASLLETKMKYLERLVNNGYDKVDSLFEILFNDISEIDCQKSQVNYLEMMEKKFTLEEDKMVKLILNIIDKDYAKLIDKQKIEILTQKYLYWDAVKIAKNDKYYPIIFDLKKYLSCYVDLKYLDLEIDNVMENYLLGKF